MNRDLQDLQKSSAALTEFDNFLKQLKTKYGPAVIEQLIQFQGHNLLKHYLNSAYSINSKKKAEFEKYNMDHFLYKIMKHHALSLFDLQYYKFDHNPTDLQSSYDKSAEIAKTIEDVDGNLAWYSNMKLPSTYLKSPEVDSHYNLLWENGLLKTSCVDIRRVHIFFNDFNETEKNLEATALFTTLILEYVLGINSKVLIIKDYDSIKDRILSLNNNQSADVISVFLLDFALYFKKSLDPVSHLPGIYYSLCSDFLFEDLAAYEDSVETRKKRYSKEMVLKFNDPKIFSILKYFYLSVWNKDKYISFLESQHPEVFVDNPLFKTGFIDILKDNIEIHNFFEFWHYLRNNNVEELFSLSHFNRLFPNKIMSQAYTSKLKDILLNNNISNNMKQSDFIKIKETIIQELTKNDLIRRKIFESQNIN